MKEPKINLLIMGKMRAGKTESTNYLETKYGAKTWATSGRIKQLSSALLQENDDLEVLVEALVSNPESRSMVVNRLLTFREMYRLEEGKPRKLYQEIGQILRDVSLDNRFCWEKDLAQQIKTSKKSFVIVDARAWESYDFFATNRSFTSLEIFADQTIRKERMLKQDGIVPEDASVFSHQSETDIDNLDFDWRIDTSDNNMHALYSRLDTIVQTIINNS